MKGYLINPILILIKYCLMNEYYFIEKTKALVF